MTDVDIKQFVKDRDDALRSLDLKQLRAYAEKYGSALSQSSDEIVEIAMHKARTASLGMTADEKSFSVKWLHDRGYHEL